MDCNETRHVLAADLDGELGLVRHLELERHLRTCAACAQAADTLRARRTALRTRLPRFTAPPALADAIRAALPPAAPAPAASASPLRAARAIRFPFWRVTALAASLALALFAGFTWGSSRAHARLLLDEAVANRLRSHASNRLNDGASADQRTGNSGVVGRFSVSPASGRSTTSRSASPAGLSSMSSHPASCSCGCSCGTAASTASLCGSGVSPSPSGN